MKTMRLVWTSIILFFLSASLSSARADKVKSILQHVAHDLNELAATITRSNGSFRSYVISNLQKKIKPGDLDVIATNELVELETGIYYISEEKLNWYKAGQKCKASGLDLASIETELENDQLKKTIFESETDEYYWLSGTDLGSEGQYYWAATGQPMAEYRDFPLHQPDNYADEEHCIHLRINYNHKSRSPNETYWNDYSCLVETRFICEYQH
ncbi:perlucin-like [Neocloeon triangulifer]|uniref:perlucin-like n=1 Tax=Neocloeon triangulifer TaxID=2078957 RepID=UPI00286F7E32|nr:perlucin-like [Neocloeon triangulifer]